MKVRYAPRALADLESIKNYLKAKSPSGARNVLSAIYKTIAILAEQPFSAQVTDDPTLRMKLVARYPYKIFYRTRADLIEVIHIRHAARRPWIVE